MTNSIDTFLNHSGSAAGAGTRRLGNWKKDGSLRLWLHTKILPIPSWRHTVPQLVVWDDKRTGEETRAFWGRDLPCWETEDFLKEQYRRDGAGNLDVGTPTKCGLCRLIDYVFRAMAAGKMSWTDEVFRFEGATERKNDVTIHAGGLTNLFSKKNLSAAETRELRDAEIYPSREWAQNFHAKCQYVLSVVNHDAPGDGVQIGAQPQTVGDKIKAVIVDAQRSLGDDEGNPMLHPFCIELTYDAAEHMSKKYHARRIERCKLTPEIEKLIRSEPPNLTSETRPFNQRRLRAFLERYAVVDLPWDRIFDVPNLGDDDAPEETETPPPEESSARGRARKPKEPLPDVPTIPCDKCGYAMREDETKCVECGTEYTIDDEDDPPPPKKVGSESGDPLPF